MKFINLYLIVPFLALSCANIGAADAGLTPSQLEHLNVLDVRLGCCVRSLTFFPAIEKLTCKVSGSCVRPYSFTNFEDSYNVDDCRWRHSVQVARSLNRSSIYDDVPEKYSKCVSAKAYTGLISGDLSDCRKALIEDMKKASAAARDSR